MGNIFQKIGSLKDRKISCLRKKEVKHKFLLTYLPTNLLTCKRCAFSLAEVLLALGIIGIIAALVVPSVYNEYQLDALKEKTKKSRISLENAIGNYINSTKAQNLISGNLLGDLDAVEEFYANELLTTSKACGTTPFTNGCLVEEYTFSDSQERVGSNGKRAVYKDVRLTRSYPNENYHCAILKDASVVCMTAFAQVVEDDNIRTVVSSNGEQFFEITTVEGIERAYGEILIDVNGREGPNFLGADVQIYYYDYNGSLHTDKHNLSTPASLNIPETESDEWSCSVDRTNWCKQVKGGKLGDAPYCSCEPCKIGETEGIYIDGVGCLVDLKHDYEAIDTCSTTTYDTWCNSTGTVNNYWAGAKKACYDLGGAELPTYTQFVKISTELNNYGTDTNIKTKLNFNYLRSDNDNNNTIRTFHLGTSTLGAGTKSSNIRALCIKE